MFCDGIVDPAYAVSVARRPVLRGPCCICPVVLHRAVEDVRRSCTGTWDIEGFNDTPDTERDVRSHTVHEEHTMEQ